MDHKLNLMKVITARELKEVFDKKEAIQLIDVREEWENTLTNIGGINIPQGEISTNISKFDKDKKTVIYCRSGVRSANIVNYLEQEHNFSDVFNLEGGILNWGEEIDNSIKPY